jgi:hypothetical protein
MDFPWYGNITENVADMSETNLVLGKYTQKFTLRHVCKYTQMCATYTRMVQ